MNPGSEVYVARCVSHEERRRAFALECALEIAAMGEVSSAVEDAKEFEAYLRGEGKK